MDQATSIALFASVWALFCLLAGVVVVDVLLRPVAPSLAGRDAPGQGRVDEIAS